MADRRKLPLLRQVLARLPTLIRYPLMRRQLKLSTTLDARFTFKIARSKEDLANAYRILHDCYVDMGYSEPKISGMRIVKYFALPTTTTLVACYDGKVVGTISIIRRGAFGVPMESVFNLNTYIEKNAVMAEISSLAIDAQFREQRGKLFLPLLKYMWEYVCRYMRLEMIVATVNPSMADFYQGFLGFKVLPHAKIDNYDFANGNPGVGMVLNVQQAHAYFKEKYGHRPPWNNLNDFFYKVKFPHFEFPDRQFFKSSDPVMTPEMLEYFFKARSNVMETLSRHEMWGLSSMYPFADYASVLPAIPEKMLRKSTRYSVRIKAKTSLSPDTQLNVLEVSAEGLCVSSAKNLEGLVLLRVMVADGTESEVRGEVRWSDPARNIYGLRLLKTDDAWSGFISYLDQDFQELLATDMASSRAVGA